MLNWYKHLYTGDTVKKKVEIYKKKLNKGKVIPDIYLLTLSANGTDQLDIINNLFLLQNMVYHRCPLVIGIAKGYEEACELVIRLTEEVIAQTGNANIKEYLLQR